MRQLNDILELEKEIEDLREALILTKNELHRIRIEYFDGALSLTETAINEVDDEMETLSLLVENALF
jgi:hypothetical protein